MRLEIHDDDRPQYRYSITAKSLPESGSGIPGHYLSAPYNYFAVCTDVEEGKRRLTAYVRELLS
jgi:hypothetical protein